MTSRGFVDYERVARRYQEGRQLPDEVLGRWRDAATRYVPADPRLVVDLGAGTGIFARAWPEWTGATVVAIEPSDAMVRTGRGAGPKVLFVRAVAEALPLGDTSADAVWISTALHHFRDVHRAVEEVGRVIAPRGRVLVRTYLPGRTEVTWLREFPGRSAWETRFPTLEQLVELFGGHDFALTASDVVFEATETFAESARWVARMRHADSILTALSDDEVEQGLSALRANPDEIGQLKMSLVVFEQA